MERSTLWKNNMALAACQEKITKKIQAKEIPSSLSYLQVFAYICEKTD
jgi:hypothetical protein